jgi:hypothetical protein
MRSSNGTLGGGDLYSALSQYKREFIRGFKSISDSFVRSSVFGCGVLTSEQRKLKK